MLYIQKYNAFGEIKSWMRKVLTVLKIWVSINYATLSQISKSAESATCASVSLTLGCSSRVMTDKCLISRNAVPIKKYNDFGQKKVRELKF